MATQRKHGISWTDETWNPIRGCTRVSEGCKFCYAERVAYRFSGPGQPYEGLAVLKNRHASWTGKIEFVEKHLLDPLSWKKPRRVFVNSMSDLFHENVTDEMRDRIFAVMALCPQHTFQVLTKRPEQMLEYLSLRTEANCYRWDAGSDNLEEKQYAMALRVESQMLELFKVAPTAALNRAADLNELRPWFPLPNVWLGVSVENQAAADERIPLLLNTPAALRFLSVEPMLGPVNLGAALDNDVSFAAEGYAGSPARRTEYVVNPPKLHWVICGGESGPGARPMHPDWARSLRDQCQAAGVPLFMKQMGSVFGPKKGHELTADLDIKQFPEAKHA